MSQTILLKVHNATKTVAEHTVVTKDGQPTVIKAQSRVNYELLNPARGTAPDHIITKRVGKDLHISLEKEGEESDIIIEGYYDNPNSAIIGIAEDGQYYYYIPDTGEVVDYVTELALGDIEGQALGGQPYVAPWWMGATTEGGILPWLVGLAAVAGIAALAKGSDDDKDTTAPSKPTLEAKEDGSIDLGLPTDAKTGDAVTVTFTPEGSNTPVTVTLTKQADGSWTSNDTSLIPNVNGNTLTIPADKIADNTPVTVVAKDPAGNTSEPVSTTAGTDGVAPSTPKLTAKDNGDVELELPTDADEGDKVEVTLTPTGSDKPVVVTLTKGPNGWESDNPAIIPNPTGDKVTVPGENVEDNTPVTVVAKDGETGKTSEPVSTTAGTDGVAPSTPKLTAKDNGDVELELPTDADEGDKVEVTLTPTGSDKPVVVTLTKGPNGWESDNPAIIPNPTGDKVTVPGENVEDNTPVTVVAKDGETGKTSEPVSTTAGTDGVAPSTPKLTAKDNGDVELELPTDADEGDKVEVTLTPTGSDKPVVVTLTKGPNGWESDNPAIIPNPTGDKVTVPGENVEDNTPVTVVAKDGETGKTSEPVSTTAGTDGVAPSTPGLTAKDNGDVELELPTDADEGDKVEVTLTPTGSDKPVVVTLTKGPNGWESDNPAIIPNPTGDKVTVPGENVEDNTPVTVVAKDGETGKTSEPVSTNTNTDGVAPSTPVVEPQDDGSVGVDLPADADIGDKVEVTLTPEGSNDPITVTLTKGPNGWTSDNKDVIPDTAGNVATIPGDKVADNTPVTAVSRDGETGKASEPETQTASPDKDATLTSPTLEPKNDGSVEVGLPTDAVEGDKVEVTLTPEGTNDPITVTLTKGPNGWESDNPAVIPSTTGNTATIPADNVEDDTPVTVISRDGETGKTSDPVTKNAGTDGVAPTAPTLEPQADGSLDVGLPTDADEGDKVEVTITPEGKTEPEVVTLTKGPNGWTSSNPDLVPNTDGNTATIPADSVADNTPVTVVAKDGASDKASDPVTKNAGTDGVAPTAPTLEPQADGSLDVGLPTDADEGDKVEVTITPEGKTEPEVVTLTKGPNGWTSSNPDLVPNTTGDKATIPADSVADNTPVTVVAKDGQSDKASDPVTKNAGTDGVAPTAPTLEPQTDGSLDVGLPTDADEGDKVEVTITPEGKTEPEVVTLTKQPDGSWTSSNPDLVPNTTGDKATIPADSVADNTPVTVVAKDGQSDKASDPVTKNAGTDGVAPTAPTLEPQTDGSLDVGLPTDADEGDKVEVTITPEGKTEPEVVTLTKQPDGSWTSSNPDLVPNTTGDKATIPADSVADNTPVTVVAKDGQSDKASDPVTKNAGTDGVAPTAPTLEPQTDGSLDVGLPTDADEGDKVEVTITPEGKTEPEVVTLTKQPDGSWTSSNPDLVPNTTGDKATIPADSVADNTPVTVVAKDGQSDKASDPVTKNAGTDTAAPDTSAPAEPTVTNVATDDKATTITGKAEPNATVEVKDKDGNVVGTAKADENGNYTVTTDKPLADGEYDVVAKDAAGNTSDPEKAVVDTQAPEAPTVTDVKTDENGTTVTGTAEPNATVELKDKDGNVVGTAKADENGNYTVTTDKPLADGEYDVVAKDAAGNDSDPAKATVDKTAPAAPTFAANDDGSVTVTAPTDADAKTMTVKVTDPVTGAEKTVELAKQDDGSWKSNDEATVPSIPAGQTSTTIPADKVKDGSKVKATATDANNNTSPEAESEPAKAGGDPVAEDKTAPAAPTFAANDDGSVTVTAPTDADAKTMTVKVTDPVTGAEKTVELAKQDDGSWKSNDEATVPSIPAGQTSTTIPADKVKDGSKVKATATDANNNTSPEAESEPAKAGGDPVAEDKTAPAAPTFAANDDGSVTVTAPTDADAKTMTVKVTDPVTGAEKTVELAKQDDGSWKSNDEATVPSIPAGQTSTTIPADKVKDGSKVKATATDANNNTSPEAESEPAKAGGDPVAEDKTAPAAPTFAANDDGSVTVTAPTDADAKTMTVKVTDPVTGAEKTVELAKQDDGSWKSNDEATVPSIPAGQTSTTIPADKVKDGSKVKATATDANNNTSPEAESEPAKAGGDPVDSTVKPVIDTVKYDPAVHDVAGSTATPAGTVTVTAGADSTNLTFSFYNEANNQARATETAFGTEGVAGTTDSIAITAVPSSASQQVKDSDQNGPTTAHQTTVVQSNKVDVVAEKVNGTWTIKSITETTPDGQVVAAANQDARVSVNGDVFTIHHNGVMGGTTVTATGSNATESADAAPKVAETDAPTIKPKAYIETVAELSDTMKAVLTDEVRKQYGITDKHLVINPETLEAQGYTNFLVYSTNVNGGPHRDAIVKESNGWSYNKEDGSKIILGSPEGRAEGYYVNNDMIILPASFSNDMKEGTEIKLFTADFNRGGDWQYLDSTVAGPAIAVEPPAPPIDLSTFQTVRADEREVKGENASFKKGSIGDTNYLSDALKVMDTQYTGAIIDLNNGKANTITWVEYYLNERAYQKFAEGRVFIKGNAAEGDAVNLGSLSNNEGNQDWAKNTGVQLDYKYGTSQAGSWSNSGEQMTVQGVTYDKWVFDGTKGVIDSYVYIQQGLNVF